MLSNKWVNLVTIIALGIVAYFTSAGSLEIVATITGLVCVWLNAKENIWAYPVGFINAGCFFYMFWNVQLYSDAILQIVFFILMAYGWYIWLTKRKGNKVRPTTKLSNKHFAYWILAILVLGALWGSLIVRMFSDAAVPYLDALLLMGSIVAQLLLSRKILQNWLIWIAVDVLSIGLYWYKGLHLTSMLYLVFLLICIQGYIGWRKNYEVRDAARKVHAAARRS